MDAVKKRILLTVAYDGTEYHGWQVQPGIRTVQGALEEACGVLFGNPVCCTGASRTDQGVHAFGQRASIDVQTSIPTEKIPLALNSLLPKDVAVRAAEEVSFSFHPRYDVKDKTYTYRIYQDTVRNPLVRNDSEWIYHPLDILFMREGAQYLVGEHDFQSFCAANTAVSSTVRRIFSLTVTEEKPYILITVRGNGFLYNMVRIIAGTLIDVGRGRIAPQKVEEILLSKDRTKAGPTAPPQGLTLVEIRYS